MISRCVNLLLTYHCCDILIQYWNTIAVQWLRLEWESKSELTFRTEPLACNTVQHAILSNTIQHQGDFKTRVPLSQPTQRPDMGARIRTPGHLDNPPDFWSPKHWGLETFGHQNAPHWKPLVTKRLWGTFVVRKEGCGLRNPRNLWPSIQRNNLSPKQGGRLPPNTKLFM